MTIWRYVCLAAAGVLGLTQAAHAQNVWLEFDYRERTLNAPEVGTPYEVTFTVHAINGATPVYISVDSAASAMPSINPAYADLQPLRAVPVTVVGLVPTTAGPFEDVIRFDYTTSTGPASERVKVKGVARLPNAPYDYSVGVIPQTSSCPTGSPLVTFHMDDEDHNNANGRDGWIGAVTSNANTWLRFCRVDGTRFHPLSVFASTPADHYAVLRMGTKCPNGFTEFVRTFDNENSDNRNEKITSSGNPSDFGPNESNNSSVNSSTKLYFCLFKNSYETMAGFPNLGMQYGVFAASDFSRSVAPGWVGTDDEDANNQNQFTGDSAGRRIIAPSGDGRNTTLNIARVTRDTRPVASCTANPSYGNYGVSSSFSSAGSFAREGRALVAFQWRFANDPTPVSGPGPYQRTFTNLNTPSQTFTTTLTVTDSAGETAATSCTVTVYGPQGS